MLERIKNLFGKKYQVTDFSSIGFEVSSVEDMRAWGAYVNSKGKQIEIPLKGSYYYLRLNCGAELWAQVGQDRQGMGLHPGFNGKSIIRVKAKPLTDGTNLTILDGLCECWLVTDDQDYPLIFEAPNFYQSIISDNEIEVNVQVTAFAKEIAIFKGKEERSKDNLWGMWAEQSFVPSGSFGVDDDPNFVRKPIAIFSGFIREVELRTNEVTGNQFYWFIVESLSANYDVVADLVLIKSLPKVGDILSGSFYLSGKIIND